MSFLSATGGGVVDASGGTTVTTFTDSSGTEYRIHAFENIGSDTFTVNSGGDVDVLVVGGGGSGGAKIGGGGGAGGVVFQSGLPVNPQSYTIVVGDGGEPQDADNSNTLDYTTTVGEDSSAFTLTALGGGVGGSHRGFNDSSDSPGTDGGSGGGEGEGGDGGTGGTGLQPGTNASADTDAGTDGGFESRDGQRVAGSGGGAGESGIAASLHNGGTGLDFSSTFGTSFGEGGYFGGGGGGGAFVDGYSPSKNSGGLGGGGDGAASKSGTEPGGDASPNTGGGGGGAAWNQEFDISNYGGAGGSGIVLIRYEI